MRRLPRGVTIVELLIVILISGMVYLAATVPFAAQSTLRTTGNARAESQRDAQAALTMLARLAHQGSGPNLAVGAAPTNTLTFTTVCAGGGTAPVTASINANRFQLVNNCTAVTSVANDGARSQTTALTFTRPSAKLIQVALTVVYNNRAQETLTTNLFLRNQN